MKRKILPIDNYIESIVASVRSRPNVILTATPGAGKTTRLPPYLTSCVSGNVIVLQPRRMAAVSACHRVCEEQGWAIGAEAGYQVRFESKVSSQTRLIFMTDALLLRRMVDDPELKGVGLVVIDEFHERNLNQDLILGCLREMQELGRDIKILVMSATLDVSRLQRFLPGNEVFDIPGQVFPLEIRHQTQNLSLRTDRSFYERVTSAIRSASIETEGDILVFLPGTGEISKTRDSLIESGWSGREIVPLHGSLPLSEQQKVLRSPDQPRVILSTNVAEASVTVQGVDFVIDSGLAKIMETHPRTGFSQLELSRISLFNARQRAGRAARQKAGVCLRLWNAFEEATQALEPVPECQRSELSQTMLLLAHLGVTELSSFSWYDHPPGTLVMLASRSLRAMGALDGEGRITPLGRQLLKYPLPPRWGGLLAAGEAMGAGIFAAEMAAVLNERDFVSSEKMKTAAPSQHECDLAFRLELLEDFSRGRAPGYVQRRAAQAVLDASKQLKSLVAKGNAHIEPADLILRSQRDRLCRRRGKGDRALMAGGRGVRLSPQSQVRQSEFFVALQGVDFPNQPDTQITLASGFSKEFILSHFKDEIQIREDVWYDSDKQQFFARRARSIDDLPIEEPVLRPATSEMVGEKMVDVFLDNWAQVIAHHEGLSKWMKRWNFLVHHKPELAQSMSPDVQRNFAEMAGYGKVRLAEIFEQNLVVLLEACLEPSFIKEFHREVPETFVAPSGVRHAVIYDELHSAFVEVRLQEMFGQSQSPRILFGELPLTFRLLGPNFRPVQVTSDLSSFWKVGYPEVRKDLRSRYPKHSWPEDPYAATPEAKGRRRT